MIAVRVDGALRDFLASISQGAQIRDSAGQILGYFKPWEVARTEIFQKAKEFFDIDEVGRRLESEGRPGFFFEEVMQHLKALEQAERALGLSPPEPSSPAGE
jgi:hypothetical protein